MNTNRDYDNRAQNQLLGSSSIQNQFCNASTSTIYLMQNKLVERFFNNLLIILIIGHNDQFNRADSLGKVTTRNFDAKIQQHQTSTMKKYISNQTRTGRK